MIIIAVIILFLVIVGAIAHEYDLAKNFKKTGNASAWFFEIKTKGDNNGLGN
jgi:uncharacterized protein YpmB